MRRFLLLLILLALPAGACLNEYEEAVPSPAAASDTDEYVAELRQILAKGRQGWPERASELEQRVKAKPADYKLRNDWAVALLHSGETEKPLRLLRQIEKEQPGLYQTAANLGTALELAGQNQEALRWIQEGIRRNPRDHEGTEWVHVKILEAKLALGQDQTWLQRNTVLGYDFGSEGQPAVPGQLSQDPDKRNEVVRAIDYQLRERLQFVQPPDPTVADLLETLALLQANPERGVAVLEFAQEFGSPRPRLVQARLDWLRRQTPTHAFPWKPVAATVALVVGLTLFRRRTR